jgi:hypothetical protein
MTDFSLEISNVPSDSYYHGQESILRAIMWERLDEIMKD